MAKIIGISSGRNKKITEKAVKTVLKATNLETKYYSLSNFEILTCDACAGCIETHKCIKDDGLEKIKNEILETEAIVFGSPEFWNGMHAKGRAFWERICFSLRHKDNFPLKETLGIAIGVSGDGNSSSVLKDIKNFYEDAQIKLVDQLEVQGEYACFICGYGEVCEKGGIAEIYDIPIEITKGKIPQLSCQHPERKSSYSIINKLKKTGKKLTDQLK